MKIYSCFTASHKALYDDHYVGSLPRTLEDHPLCLDMQGSDEFLSGDFIAVIRHKLRLIIDSIEANRGAIIVWSDVDIVLRRDPTPSIEAIFANDDGLEIVFQRERKKAKTVNAGFTAMRCTDGVKGFFERVIEVMAANPQWNEQMAINHLLLARDDPVAWNYLPWTFYARTHGWPPPRDLVLYHANMTRGADGLGQKMAQFRELAFIERYGTPARLWSCARRVPGHLARMLTGRTEQASAGADTGPAHS
jgi:hypothetical protein